MLAAHAEWRRALKGMQGEGVPNQPPDPSLARSVNNRATEDFPRHPTHGTITFVHSKGLDFLQSLKLQGGRVRID